MDHADDRRTTRRGFIVGAGLAAAAIATPIASARRTAPWTMSAGRSYVSRPDLQPPVLHVTTKNGPSPGLVFLAPFDLAASIGGTPSEGQFGALIVDDDGFPVWFRESAPGLTIIDLQVQRYRGRPVLTWYEGHVLDSYGGTWMVADRSYRQIARIRAGNGYRGDLHECRLTTRGTALITIYSQLKADLTSIGGPVDGKAVEGIVQEIDVATGKVLFEWHSLSEIALDETYMPAVTAAGNVDYFHLNSIGVDDDGHLLVSARHTSAIYKLHRKTGKILWRLGGKKSDFAFAAGASFAYQHDARRHRDGTITLFDNAAFSPDPGGAVGPTSRPMRLSLDMATMTASLVEEYSPGDNRVAFAMGNLQQLPDESAMVGWGTLGSSSEIAPDGTLRWDGSFDQGVASYRAYRSPWVGRPAAPPDAVITTTPLGERLVYVSWNGATQVVRWRLSTGPNVKLLSRLRTRNRVGFETAISLSGAPRRGVAVVEAIDKTGKVIGSTRPLRF